MGVGQAEWGVEKWGIIVEKCATLIRHSEPSLKEYYTIF